MVAELTASEKILLAIYALDEEFKGGKKITKEEMVVKVWKLYPQEFSIKGYPQYPNADISKYVTKLFKDNLLTGSFYNYILTQKGRDYAGILKAGRSTSKKNISNVSRHIFVEISRIKKLKIFNLFLNGETNFLESDFFDFFGTSARALNDSNKTAFTSRYNLIVKEVIPFCEKNVKDDVLFGKIVEMENILLKKFAPKIEKETKVKK